MVTSPALVKPWSIGKRIGILFFTFYFAFLLLDFTSSDELFPHFVYVLFTPYTSFWNWVVPFTGSHILHLSYPITVKPNGSGDTTFNYVLQLLWIVFAIIPAVIIAVIDRKRIHYANIYYWLRILIRYYFAFMLFVYGFVKIIKLQFPAPSLGRLVEPFGDATPMGLAWTFIGYSTGYNIFIGGAEVVAGALLFFKRTTLLGSLLALIVMSNVAAMNFAFDIPVKIFSVNLVVLAAFLASYDWIRIRNVFFLNATAPPSYFPMPQPTKWKRILQRSLKVVAIGFSLYSTFWSSWNQRSQYGDQAPKPPLYGIYNVTKFVRNANELPPLTTDTIRWKQIIINYPNTVRITSMADSTLRMKLNIDTIKHTALFTDYRDSTITYEFRYSRPNPGRLVFSGRLRNDSSIIEMNRFDESQFKLVKTGFNWINEYPNNR